MEPKYTVMAISKDGLICETFKSRWDAINFHDALKRVGLNPYVLVEGGEVWTPSIGLMLTK